jgi:SsrA-binding protein
VSLASHARAGRPGRGVRGRLPGLGVAKPPGSRPKSDLVKSIATNRKAFHDYFITDRLEVGLVLSGTEVKSLREGRAQLKDSYVHFRDREAFLVGVHISPYGSGSWTNHPPERDRKLLLHRRELDRWASAVATRGVACVPLSLYFRGSRAKAEIALVKGKKLHDKRDAIRERDLRREADREMRGRK